MSENTNKPEDAKKVVSDKVKIRLPKIRGDSDAPVYVNCNKKDYKIKRGVDVEVPRAVLNTLLYADKEVFIYE